MRRLLVAAVLAVAGCTSSRPRTMYGWDGYEESLYRYFTEPADVDPGAEAHALEESLQQEIQDGHAVPPRFHAHLALLHPRPRDTAAAEAALRAEMAAFPESSVFVEGMLRRMGR